MTKKPKTPKPDPHRFEATGGKGITSKAPKGAKPMPGASKKKDN